MTTILTAFYTLLFYIASTVFVLGVTAKVYQYAKTPAPLNIPLMPAPLTRRGVALRLLTETILFRSLFRANKWLWLFGWLFHTALIFIMLRHLRYFLDPVPTWVFTVQPMGKYASFIMLFALIGLLLRRIILERIRYISNPSDYLLLILFLFIGITGLLMTFVIHTDIVQLKTFIISLLQLNWQQPPLPTDIVLLLHLSSVILLMLIFPFSKLLHAPSIFFTPSHQHVDNRRK
ncbi:nitrate reductase [Beggiatoa leptomitoformis]|uniref:Nitrate reductase n=1 Tax=Beggiatoa leptomitoformis TaxID=288004 RepID=A0A2N9YI90_9GAMM|nr:nitrate reductase [Beggiatoa leptomitoformis]AUI70204.2 nitrate reductase [Beggiatoa leptomitoformis]